MVLISYVSSAFGEDWLMEKRNIIQNLPNWVTNLSSSNFGRKVKNGNTALTYLLREIVNIHSLTIRYLLRRLYFPTLKVLVMLLQIQYHLKLQNSKRNYIVLLRFSYTMGAISSHSVAKCIYRRSVHFWKCLVSYIQNMKDI